MRTTLAPRPRTALPSPRATARAPPPRWRPLPLPAHVPPSPPPATRQRSQRCRGGRVARRSGAGAATPPTPATPARRHPPRPLGPRHCRRRHGDLAPRLLVAGLCSRPGRPGGGGRSAGRVDGTRGRGFAPRPRRRRAGRHRHRPVALPAVPPPPRPGLVQGGPGAAREDVAGAAGCRGPRSSLSSTRPPRARRPSSPPSPTPPPRRQAEAVAPPRGAPTCWKPRSRGGTQSRVACTSQSSRSAPPSGRRPSFEASCCPPSRATCPPPPPWRRPRWRLRWPIFRRRGLSPCSCSGLLFGGVYARTRSLGAAVAAHSLWNCYIFAQLVMGRGGG